MLKYERNWNKDIFYDRDITISYQSFNITDQIEMQVNELQITGDKAKLYLYVKEKEKSSLVPFKYIVYNENGTKTYDGVSSKKGEISYKEILELKNYVEKQNKLVLQVYSNEEILLKTVTIDLRDRTIEARSETSEVKKISQIKLNEFLAKETKMNNKENNDKKKVLVFKVTDISYSDSIYTVIYLYSEVTDEEINNGDVEDMEIKVGIAQFKLKDNEFEMIKIEEYNDSEN